ncbi:DUF4349 domain-containing protein [Leeuwenhoekiella sp. W20_SRS_FM14]|uniref:DUF4349 domain-containing protein n=1 Tax=Leeuwenhoekiella sp. W20_SRS_FM14 TaxID=3240270 RepID=UPI003F9CFAAF
MKILGFTLLSLMYMCGSPSSEVENIGAMHIENDVYADEQPAPNLQVADIEQKIIKTGRIRFETQDLIQTRTQVLKAVEASNGYVQNENSGKDYSGNFQELELRIPTQNFQKALDLISDGVAFFDEKSISRRDITEEFIDLEARLKAKRELEMRYLDLLKKANSVKDILEIERELSVIREEIESKQGRLNYLSKQVSYSTLTVNFYKISVENGITKSYGSKILQAIKGGWQGISTFLLGLIYIWPFIIILIVAIFLLRRWQKRNAKKRNSSI